MAKSIRSKIKRKHRAEFRRTIGKHDAMQKMQITQANMRKCMAGQPTTVKTVVKTAAETNSAPPPQLSISSLDKLTKAFGVDRLELENGDDGDGDGGEDDHDMDDAVSTKSGDGRKKKQKGRKGAKRRGDKKSGMPFMHHSPMAKLQLRKIARRRKYAKTV